MEESPHSDVKHEPATTAGDPAAEPTAEPSLLSGAPHPGSAELCSPTAAAAVGSVALCSPGTTAGASAAAYSSGAENPATDTGPATATDSSTAQHAAGEPTRDADAAEAAAAGSTAGTGAGPAEPLKSCNLCCTQFPRSEFKVLSGGRRASYCVKCTSYVCQGRTRRLSIHDLRRAMKSNELETLLRGEAPLPADHKRCQLCAEVLELSNFRQLPRGGHESYCGTCSKYVRRGTKLGLNIEGVRKAREDGTLDNLVKDMVAACKPGHKRCNLCSEEKAVNDFSTTSKGRSSYCTMCERLVRRGHNKGLQMETMRNAFKDGSIHTLLPPPATSARPDRKAQAVPEGHKVCNLCESVLEEAAFKLKYDGSLGSYCSPCDKLVGRGRRRGLTMEAMRTGFKDGSLHGLLESFPVTGSVGAGPADPRTSSGSKECNLCARELPLSSFRVSAGTRVGAYCIECDKIIGRGRRRGLTINALRQFMEQGQLQEVLGLTKEGSRSGEGSGTSEAPAHSLSLDAGAAGGSAAGLQSAGSAALSVLLQAQQARGTAGVRSDAAGGSPPGMDAAGSSQGQQHGTSSMAVQTLAATLVEQIAHGSAFGSPASALDMEGAGRSSPTGLKRDLEGTQPAGEKRRPKISAQSADPERTDSETLSD